MMDSLKEKTYPGCNEKDVFKILVTSDNHLGYLERDPVRSEDSFRTFEEVLKIASNRKVDFILQAGDLFHDNRPSRNCLYKTVCLLRKYCLGTPQNNIKILSDQKQSFKTQLGVSNCTDRNYSIALPIFAIHGNHDDPSGVNRLSVLDVLGATGLINYYGKQDCVDEIKIYPLLLSKGRSLLALYGLGNIRDERLNRTFRQRSVKMIRPSERSEEWFNILSLHQNRYQHGSKSNYIPEDFLANFLQLVIWGHEHDCRIDPIHNYTKEFDVIQPGSPLVTSLTRKEMCEKYVCILQVADKSYTSEKIQLETPRSFIYDEILLDPNIGVPNNPGDTIAFLKDKVEQMISLLYKNKYSQTSELRKNAEAFLPLVRLKINYTSDNIPVHPQMFGRLIENKVANPRDVLSYSRKSKALENYRNLHENATDCKDKFLNQQNESISIETLINGELSKHGLEILPEAGFSEAVRVFVEKDDNNSIKEFIQRHLALIREGCKETQVKSDIDHATLELKLKAVSSKILSNTKNDHKTYTKSSAVGYSPNDILAHSPIDDERSHHSGTEGIPETNVFNQIKTYASNGHPSFKVPSPKKSTGDEFFINRVPNVTISHKHQLVQQSPQDIDDDEMTFTNFRDSIVDNAK